MFTFTLGLIAGVLVGWHVTKPALLDVLTKKIIGLFKKN